MLMNSVFKEHNKKKKKQANDTDFVPKMFLTSTQ